ncbi:AMP-binding protein [Curtobacterium sp. 24E2]
MPNPNVTTAYRAARDQLLSAESADAARADFRWPDLGDTFNWANDWFDVIAAGNDRIALWIVDAAGSEQRLSYAEMAARSDRLAVRLHEHGVRKGDHVLVMLGNQLELWETMLAVIKLGAVILPTSTMLDTADLQDRVDRGAVAHVVTNRSETAKYDHVRGDFSRVVIGGTADGWTEYPSDLGEPAPAGSRDRSWSPRPPMPASSTSRRARPRSRRWSCTPRRRTPSDTSARCTGSAYGLGTCTWRSASPGWGKHAWSCFFAPWIAEATVFVHDTPRFDPAALLAQLDAAEVSTFCAPPTAWRMMLQSDLGARPRALREVVSAGEPLNPEVIDRVERAWGLTIRDGYGQTETTAIIGNAPGSTVTPGAMGRALPGVTVTLLDPVTGQPGDEGEVCLDLDERPVNLMAEYLGDPDRTAASMRDGFFHTGDIAVRDADGELTFIGRTDDVFKSSDYKVSPFEVESALLQHPAVAESAVVPAPDDARLNVVKAYVSLAAGFEATADTAEQVLAYARTALPAYARVRRVEFAELPKTISGKIRRVELREREERAAVSGVPVDGEWRDEQFPALRASRPRPPAVG